MDIYVAGTGEAKNVFSKVNGTVSRTQSARTGSVHYVRNKDTGGILKVLKGRYTVHDDTLLVMEYQVVSAKN